MAFWKSPSENRGATSRLTKDSDVGWVAAKALNVFPHPLQSLDLIEEAKVCLAQLWVRKVSEEAQAVVDGDKNHWIVHRSTIAHQRFARVLRT